MTRPDLNESDMMGLDHTYRKACAERRFAALDREPADLPRAGNTALICAAIFAASVLACAVIFRGWPWL